jgi:hypothetical protein
MVYSDDSNVPDSQCSFINRQMATLLVTSGTLTDSQEDRLAKSKIDTLELNRLKPRRTLESFKRELSLFYLTDTDMDLNSASQKTKPQCCTSKFQNDIASSGASGGNL